MSYIITILETEQSEGWLPAGESRGDAGGGGEADVL